MTAHQTPSEKGIYSKRKGVFFFFFFFFFFFSFYSWPLFRKDTQFDISFYHNNWCVYSSKSTLILMCTLNIWLSLTSLNYPHLPNYFALWLTLSDSNYSCLEQFSMDPKTFEPLKFDCITFPATILHKSIADRYRPVSYPDGPITTRYKFM